MIIKILKIIFVGFVAVLAIFVANLYLLRDTASKSTAASSDFKKAFSVADSEIKTVTNDECGEVCKATIAEEVAKAIATVSGTVETRTIVEKVTTATATPTQTTYVSLGTSGTTSSTDWITLEDTAVYIDPENDYGSAAVFTWEASLKVAHGNGQTFARLFDETNGIAVSGSELSTTSNADFSQAKSGNLPFWRGNNIYKVQVKSLNGFEVTYSGGRIKVSY